MKALWYPHIRVITEEGQELRQLGNTAKACRGSQTGSFGERHLNHQCYIRAAISISQGVCRRRPTALATTHYFTHNICLHDTHPGKEAQHTEEMQGLVPAAGKPLRRMAGANTDTAPRVEKQPPFLRSSALGRTPSAYITLPAHTREAGAPFPPTRPPEARQQ